MLSLDKNVVGTLFLLVSLCPESYAVAISDPDVGVFIVIVGSAAAGINFCFFALIHLNFYHSSFPRRNRDVLPVECGESGLI